MSRNSQVVLPSRADVLWPVPARPGAAPTASYPTMTTRNPRASSDERFVAHALLGRWQSATFPAPLWLWIASALVLAVGALVLMVQFLFPWLAQFTQLADSTIGSARHP